MGNWSSCSIGNDDLAVDPRVVGTKLHEENVFSKPPNVAEKHSHKDDKLP
jgi:hypothetical protein